MGRGAARARRLFATGARRSRRARLLRPFARRVLALVSRRRHILSALSHAAGHAGQCCGMAAVGRLAHRHGRAHRFFDFMVPYNWCQVPQSALFVLVGLVSAGGVLSTQASEAMDLAAAIATLLYEWFIARVALDTTGLVAVFVVLLDLVLGVMISRVTGWLY